MNELNQEKNENRVSSEVSEVSQVSELEILLRQPGPFDVERAIALMRAENLRERGHSRHRKLSHARQCQAFAAMYSCSARNQTVARAFGITTASASHIAGCLDIDPDPFSHEMKIDPLTDEIVDVDIPKDHNRNRNPNRKPRYQNVAREFKALGEAEFNRRYVTQGLIDRLERVRLALIEEKRNRPPDFSKMSTKDITAWRDQHEPGWRERVQKSHEDALREHEAKLKASNPLDINND